MDESISTQYRNGDRHLLARCTWDGQTIVYPLNSCMSFDSLREEVYRRFHFRSSDSITLRYSLPRCQSCLLDGESDFKVLFSAAQIYSLQEVDISVSKDNVITSSTTHEVDRCEIIEVDDYLGVPFRSEVQKPFLSDEWCGYIQCVHQKFKDGVDEFRRKLKMYAAAQGFMYTFQRNDGRYLHIICANSTSEEDNVGGKEERSKCNWFIKGYEVEWSGAFFISEMDNVHTCKRVIRKRKHPMLDSDVVMTCIEPDIMYNSALRPKDIMHKFSSCYGFDISYKVALNAKEKALTRLYGEDAESFNKLTWYREVVLESNPGSYFELEVDPVTDRFKRVFLAYGGCVKGFEFCLPVLYVDGTFGKSLYKGQILAATGRNGNQGFFPLAMCICDSESEDNWHFFFRNLRNVIEQHGREITFISDRGIGLLSAFDKVFPANPHLFCYKHLKYNLNKRYSGRGKSLDMKKVRECFFKLAYSSTEKEYWFNLKELRNEGGPKTIDDFLKDIPVENWCRAFSKGSRYGIMANSIAESFNNWISIERVMPVYSLLEQTRLKIMGMNSSRRAESLSWTTMLTPVMESELKDEMGKCRRFSVHDSDDGVYEVRSEHKWAVNLKERTCSCVKWQINCFPCPHALAAIQKHSDGDVYEFIDPLFTADSFKKAYSFPLHPITDVDEDITESTANYVFPPLVKAPPGRRKKKRIMSGGESEKKSITCSRCHQKGNHNRLTCIYPI